MTVGRVAVTIGLGNETGGREVGLVADEDDDDAFLCDLAQVVQPAGDGVESGAAGDVVDEEGAGCTAEVGARDGFVGFLAGGVPEGEFHAFLVGRWGGVGGGGGGGGGS